MTDEQVREFRRHLRKLERAVWLEMQQDMECCGITTAQCHALLEIEERGVTTVSALAEELNLDRSTLSRTVDSLVKAGLVDRGEDPANRRSSRLVLQPAGTESCAAIHRQCNEFYRLVLQRIPTESHTQVQQALQLLSEALETTQRELGQKPTGKPRCAPCGGDHGA